MGGTDARRVGVLGGTFDPIHRVHLLMAATAARALDLNTVLFVPTGEPGHRDPRRVTPAVDRCAMVAAALAAARDSRFRLSTVDAVRGRPTYSVDTLRDLALQYGGEYELYFIIGSDNLPGVLQWRRSGEVLQRARFVATSRFGYPLVDPGFPHGRLFLVRIPELDISATQIRQRVLLGQPIDALTPAPVVRYISDRMLYSRGIAKDVFSGDHAVLAPRGE